jgi:hypothetical protein
LHPFVLLFTPEEPQRIRSCLIERCTQFILLGDALIHGFCWAILERLKRRGGLVTLGRWLELHNVNIVPPAKVITANISK